LVDSDSATDCLCISSRTCQTNSYLAHILKVGILGWNDDCQGTTSLQKVWHTSIIHQTNTWKSGNIELVKCPPILHMHRSDKTNHLK
jgi:hypothetical protein